MSTASPALVSDSRKGLAVNLVRSHLVLLTLVFIVTLPLVNPLVHGDGVGYYAYLRAPLIQHNFRFEEDWRHANLGFAESRLNSDNQLRPDQYTKTGLFVSGIYSPSGLQFFGLRSSCWLTWRF